MWGAGVAQPRVVAEGQECCPYLQVANVALREPLPKFECLLNEWQLLARALPGAGREGVLDGVWAIQPVAWRQAALAACGPSLRPKDAGLILYTAMSKNLCSGEERSSGWLLP